MELDLNREIDACFYGNNTRFINHCCGEQFNTAAVPVVFNQQLTIFIVALHDIHEDEFLSYNYGPQKTGSLMIVCVLHVKDK
jgi:SET domain-containing protein